MTSFMQQESIEFWLPFFNGECPQFSQSQLCPAAPLQPWALETQKYTVEVIRFWRRASFCYCASPDSPLFITAKKSLSPMPGWRSCSGCCFGAEYPGPCGGTMWSMGQNMILQHSRVALAESEESAMGSVWALLKLYFSAGLRYLLQDPLLWPLCTPLHWKISQEFHFFPSKTQLVLSPITKHWEISCRKGPF